MLDSNKDGLKLEAMKRIIGMVAKGRDASDLFPGIIAGFGLNNMKLTDVSSQPLSKMWSPKISR
jgi:vesicle coat complex subunit